MDDVTLGDLVIALHEVADSPREALAALDHLLRTQRVRFERPGAAARLCARLGGSPEAADSVRATRRSPRAPGPSRRAAHRRLRGAAGSAAAARAATASSCPPRAPSTPRASCARPDRRVRDGARRELGAGPVRRPAVAGVDQREQRPADARPLETAAEGEVGVQRLHGATRDAAEPACSAKTLKARSRRSMPSTTAGSASSRVTRDSIGAIDSKWTRHPP